MNTWILPELKKDIDALKQKEIANKEDLKDEDFLDNNLCPNYILIDAALWSNDIDLLFLDEDVVYRSLFKGSTGEELWSVAPYLADISSNEGLVEKIKEINRNEPINRRITWLSSPLNIDELRKHLRRFLRMKREDDSYVYFRFYDPFVIKKVFPNLTKEQATEFFERIDYVMTDDIRVNERHIFYLSPDKTLQVKSKDIDYVDNNR
jgi:hypothetical protein